MKIEIGKIYYTTKYNEMFKCISKEDNFYSMKVIYADSGESAYKEYLDGLDAEQVTCLGTGEFTDYPEYLL